MYETKDDLAQERQTIDRYLSVRQDRQGQTLQAIKMHMKYGADFALMSPSRGIVAFAEVRRRHHPFAKYPDVILSLLKWQTMMGLERDTLRPALLVFEFNDGIYEHRVGYHSNPNMWFGGRAMGGKKGRGDSQDKEPVVKIPQEQWVTICLN
jgi:hypothetical protein